MTDVPDRIAPPPAATADWISQGTAIEQSRAVAEVQAMVIVAQERPRDLDRAVREMRRAVPHIARADKAFYSYPRGRETVTGATVYLARELARSFGNMTHGIVELRRDDARGLSEMQAYAWDLEANSRVAQTFIVPHIRRSGGRSTPLVDPRDIYETTANNGARRVREAIFAVLPAWYRDEAISLARATLEGGDGIPLEERRATAVDSFAKADIGRAVLERKIGRRVDEWTEADVTDLGILFQSLRRREITREEAFGEGAGAGGVAVTADEISAGRQDTPTEAPPEEESGAEEGGDPWDAK